MSPCQALGGPRSRHADTHRCRRCRCCQLCCCRCVPSPPGSAAVPRLLQLGHGGAPPAAAVAVVNRRRSSRSRSSHVVGVALRVPRWIFGWLCSLPCSWRHASFVQWLRRHAQQSWQGQQRNAVHPANNASLAPGCARSPPLERPTLCPHMPRCPLPTPPHLILQAGGGAQVPGQPDRKSGV
jgi:hypothetical protein